MVPCGGLPWGYPPNIIEASYQAVTEGLEYGLMLQTGATAP